MTLSSRSFYDAVFLSFFFLLRFLCYLQESEFFLSNLFVLCSFSTFVEISSPVQIRRIDQKSHDSLISDFRETANTPMFLALTIKCHLNYKIGEVFIIKLRMFSSSHILKK